jgi:hypothetical protein
VPVGGGVGKVFYIGDQPFIALSHYYTNVVRPDFGPEWSLRFQIGWLLPEGIF